MAESGTVSNFRKIEEDKKMQELSMKQVQQVSGGLDPDTGALAIMGLAVLGGPFTAAFGLTIGIGLLFREV